MTFVVVDNGKIRKSEDIQLAEKVIEVKKNEGPWEVIDLLVRAWVERSPAEFKGFKLQVSHRRDGLYDKKYGQTAEGKDHERRMTVIFPQSLYMMIRSVLKPDEFKMDKEFNQEFARRYPMFRIPEKL